MHGKKILLIILVVIIILTYYVVAGTRSTVIFDKSASAKLLNLPASFLSSTNSTGYQSAAGFNTK